MTPTHIFDSRGDVGRRPGVKLSFFLADNEFVVGPGPEEAGMGVSDSVLPRSTTVFEFDLPESLDPPLSVDAPAHNSPLVSETSNQPIGPATRGASEGSYSELPPSNFLGLKTLLYEYLFGSLSEEKKFPLDAREMVLLKYLLKKKFCYSHRADFASKIELVCAENVVAFLRRHPQKKRTQLFKRMVFTKFWKSLVNRGVDVIKEFFGGNSEFDYRAPINNSGGNPTGSYYDRCFAEQKFRCEFLRTCETDEFWEFCRGKAIKGFESNFLKWMGMIDEYLTSPQDPAAERKMLMKIKFMSLDSDSKRISHLFGI